MKTLFDSGTRTTSYLMDPADLVFAPPGHPLYQDPNDRPVDQAFIANIKASGNKTPILVAKIDDKPWIVAGRRRALAILAANRALRAEHAEPLGVLATPVRGTLDQLREIMLSENAARKDDPPLVMAKKISDFIACGRDEDQASRVFSRPVSTIRQLLALLESQPSVQSAVAAGQLSPSAAVVLNRMPTESIAETVEKAKSARVTVADVLKRGRADKNLLPKPTTKELRKLLKRHDTDKSFCLPEDALSMLKYVLTGVVPRFLEEQTCTQ